MLSGPASRSDARAWGPGAGWLLAGVPELLGVRGSSRRRSSLTTTGFARHSASDQGMRIPRTRLVMESLVPAILEQLVTGIEARRSWRQLVTRFGEPAPGPVPDGLMVMPEPATWVALPDWEWHRAGVDGRRRQTLVAAARLAPALERTVDLPPVEAKALLRTVPGVGVWTAAEVAARAYGDVDAVSVGDYHLAAAIGWATARPAGRRPGDARAARAVPPTALPGDPADPCGRSGQAAVRPALRAPRQPADLTAQVEVGDGQFSNWTSPRSSNNGNVVTIGPAEPVMVTVAPTGTG